MGAEALEEAVGSVFDKYAPQEEVVEQEEVKDEVDEEPVEQAESEDEGNDEPSEDEAESDEDEGEEADESNEDDDEDEDEESDKYLEIANNLKTALHKEREKRKQLAEEAEVQQGQLMVVNDYAEKAHAQLEAIKKQLEELDLLDVVEVKMPDIDKDKVEELQKKAQEQAQKAAEETIGEIQTLTAEKVTEYKHINPESDAQGVLLGQAIIGAINAGSSVEDAVTNSLNALNSILEVYSKRGQVAKKAAPKRKAVKVKSNGAAKAKQRQAALDTGDFSSLFQDIGRELAGSE